MNTQKKSLSAKLVTKINKINNLLMKSYFSHIGNPTKSVQFIKEAHEIFKELKAFYVVCETNKKLHEERLKK